MDFVHLHVHSSLSPSWGVRSPEDLCAEAKAMGMSALALTDRNGLYGLPRFLACAREEGLSPIVGAEAVTADSRAVLLVRTEEGYSNLCRLLSDLHCRDGFDLAAAIAERREGLAILTDDPPLLLSLRRRTRDGLYVEMSPGHGLHRALALSRETALPPVATCRAVLISPEDFETHRVIRAISRNTKLSRLAPEDCARETDRLLAPDRLADLFPHCPQALENAAALAGTCLTKWDFLERTLFPAFRGMEDEEAFAVLAERSRAGALWRYGRMDDGIGSRLARELGLIRDKGFAHYFLVVEELARQCPRTCGRGSAAASLVAYCLGITHVDPIRHNLFFERFLNEGRTDPPDIDVDFPWDERDGVLDFAFALYGARRAAMVANHVSFRARAAVREVAKVFGIPADQIRDVTRRLSGYGRASAVSDRICGHPAFRGERFSEDWLRVFAVASRLEGQLRHLSLHCGGLVVVPDEIRRRVPVQVAPKGLPVIQWEKDQAEAAGLVKIDILGNRSLAVIRDALAAVRANGGPAIEYPQMRPLEDEGTQRLLREGRTMGCFYVESPATRQLLARMWGADPVPRTMECDLFEHLVMASSIIRPAANAFILEFVARMRGKPWRHLHPLLDGVLGETYGIAIYQEQITQMAMALAGFSAHEGDLLRKVVTKKTHTKKLEDFRERFFDGAARRGISNETTSLCWDQILSFSGYSFCKPHSASYALVSCKSAYLKANHPAEFLAAVISNQGGFYSPLAYLSEARRMGLAILPPDVNESRWEYTGRDRRIRVGLMQIQGLERSAADALLREREEGGWFSSFTEFLRRVRVDPSDARLLVRAGCFDPLEGLTRRPALAWHILKLAAGPERGAGTLPLFTEATDRLPEPPPYDEKAVLDAEIDTLGFLVSRHPLELYRGMLDRVRTVPALEMGRHVGRSVTLAGWWVTGKPVPTKHGEPMEFVTFEDTTASFETTFFPRAYARFCRRMVRHRPYLLRGTVEEQFGVPTLNVRWMGLLDQVPASVRHGTDPSAQSW